MDYKMHPNLDKKKKEKIDLEKCYSNFYTRHNVQWNETVDRAQQQ